MARKGRARPVDPPKPKGSPKAYVSPDGAGLEGTVAAIAGRTDNDDHVRRMVQQAYRQVSYMGWPTFGADGWHVAEALYQQLVGSWTEADEHRLSDWRTRSATPEFIEGPNGFAHERVLSDKALAELKRAEPYP